MRKTHTPLRLLGCFMASQVALTSLQAQQSRSLVLSHLSSSWSIESDDSNANKQHQSLLDALKTLNKTHGMYFLLSQPSLGDTKVSTQMDMNASIESILQQLLKNTGLQYKKVNENTFVILSKQDKKNIAQSQLTSVESLDATGAASEANLGDPVTGRITGADGAPMAGVSVSIKGTKKGVFTNSKGEFSLEANKGDVLVISYVGYATTEVTVQNSVVNMAINPANQQMNEVVVTALGVKKDARKLGYAVSKVDGESLTKAREINIGNALVGKVAGVNSTGPLTGPGGSSRVTIRGNSSLTGNNQPLYVVNGVPLNNDNLGSAGKWGGADLGDGISSINPDDIEDMTVLKGAAAAALYGQRAQNGVIMITTKSGKARKGIGLELNSNFTIDQVNDFTDFQTTYGQGTLGNKPTDQTSALQTGLSSWGAPLDGSNVTLFDGKQHAYSAQGSNLKGFYKDGSTLTNTLSMYGGTEAATFRVSIGDLRNSAIYPNAKYNRNNVNLDLSYKLTDKWSGAANVSYIKEIGKNRSNLSDGPGNGNYGILFLPPNVNQQYLAPGFDNQLNEIQYYNEPWNTNPHFAANRFQNNTNKDRVVGMASLRFAPVKWFYVQGRVANDFYAFNAQSITPTGTAYRPTGSLDMDRTILFNESNMDLMLGSHHQVGDFDMNFMLGGNILKMNSKFSDINANGLAFPFLYNPSAATTRGANISTPKKEVHSIYGSAELSYKNMLFLNITDRNDWSSALPAGNNSYNYPAVSLAWTFSEIYRPSWLNYGKVRVGYAQVGSDTDPFQTMQYYNSLTNVNGAPAGNIGNNIPNNLLEPRKIKELEAGIELKALQNRLTFDFTVYNKQTLNDIVQGTVSGTSGYESAILNVGKLQNKGIELMIGGTPVKTRNFRWMTNFNYAHNHNKVISLAEGQNFMNIGESRTERGFIQHRLNMPFAQVMVYDFKRDAKGSLVVGPTGLPLASDVLVSAGTGIPPITGGWSNDFHYKQLSFSFLIDYKFGGVIYSGTNARAYSYGLHKETLNGRKDGIVVKGVNDAGSAVTTTVTAQNYYTDMSRVSMLHVYDADFIKFRSMVLSYTIPSSVFKQKVQSMTVSLVGRNLFYIMRKTDNIDPESNYNNSNAQGLEYAGLPSVRSYGVNLNVKF